MKILNLYAGIGGNRKLWGDEHDITAVEYDEGIAKVYADLFPSDTLIVDDAHQYLLENHKKFDFIWSSPPCQTHSSFRYNIDVRLRVSIAMLISVVRLWSGNFWTVTLDRMAWLV